MSVALAAGHPNYKTAGFIPDFYADEFNVTYYQETLLPRITNSKFTGKVKSVGDKVTIPSLPSISVEDYTKGKSLTYENPTSSAITLTVDRAKVFKFAIDDVDEAQTNLDLGRAFREDGVERVRIAIESDFFTAMASQAAAANRGATAGAVSSGYDLGTSDSPLALDTTNIVQVLTRIRAVFGEANAWKKGVSVVMPEWARYLLVNSDLKNASIMGDAKSVLRTGMVGEIDGMKLYCSNLLDGAGSAEDPTYFYAFNPDAVAYVGQLTRIEQLRSPTTMGDLYRGLFVYDWKAIKPEGMVEVVARDAST